MTFVLYTNSISAHQLPLARELARLVGAKNFRYVYERESVKGNQRVDADDPWVLKRSELESTRSGVSNFNSLLLDTCDILLVGGLRPIELIERRLAAGKVTFFMTERWFKPLEIKVGRLKGWKVGGLKGWKAGRLKGWKVGRLKGWKVERLLNSELPFFNFRLQLPLYGWLRLLLPSYFRMARAFVKFLESPYYRFLPIGPWAARDMRMMRRVLCLRSKVKGQTKDDFIPWGDFVEARDVGHGERVEHKDCLKVLWVGRLLDWKRVDTIIRAVAWANQFGEGQMSKVKGQTEDDTSSLTSDLGPRTSFSLTIVGDGPEKSRLQSLTRSLSAVDLLSRPTFSSTPQSNNQTIQQSNNQTIQQSNNSPVPQFSTPIFSFLPSVPIHEVRALMRQHDIYILSSSAQEGWGAVVPEALTEGMTVLGTFEAGASAALLPKENLFHCGDWKALAKMLLDRTYRHIDLPKDYTPKGAAERLMQVAGKIIGRADVENGENSV